LARGGDDKPAIGQRGPRDWRRRLVVAAVGVGAIVAVLGLVATNAPLFARFRNIVFDGYQRLTPRPPAGAPLALVDIDEGSMAKLGQWPWPRSLVATMVDRLGQLGAATIAFDIVFPEADRSSPGVAVAALQQAGAKVDLPTGIELDNDAVLARSFAANPVVAGIAISNETAGALPPPKAGFSFGGPDPKTYLVPFRGGISDLSVLTSAAPGLGSFSFPPSADGVVRNFPLVASAQGNLYPALSVEALRLAQGAGSFAVRSTGASGEADTGQPAMTAFKVGALSMPAGPDGEFEIYYSGLPEMPVISAADLLDPKASAALADKVEGRIILIGTSAVGLRDLVATPLAVAVPGARVHAEIIDQIIGQVFLSRPDWALGAEISLAVLCGLVVIALEAFGGAVVSTIGTLLLVGATAGFSWWLFAHERLLFDPIVPSMAAGLVFALATPVLLLWTDREKRFIRGAFSRYLSPELVGRLAGNPAALQLGGEMRDLTIMFTDIRNFTSLSESLTPVELTGLLNNFLTPATDVLLRSEATIDKYIGDAIMAFWNAPLDIADHRRKACLAALALLDTLEAVNQRHGLNLRIGVGLNSGECCVGNFGSAQRFSYSAIGDSVNVASRVEGLTKQYHLPILVTDATRRGATDLAFIEADLVRVVGRVEPIPVYALLGDAQYAQSAAFAAFGAAQQQFLALYRERAFEAAKAAGEAARQLAPASVVGLYDVYAERLALMVAEPPAEGWDGVFVLRQK
jgi:adenylate cyclase